MRIGPYVTKDLARSAAVVLAATLVLALAGPERSVVAQSCTDRDPNAALQYLRRLSLDLRGHVPTVAELEMVEKTGVVSDDLIDKMIASPQMLTRLRAYHRELLWTSLAKTQITNVNWILERNGSSGPLYVKNRAGRYRGAAEASCPNTPAQIDGSGAVVQDGYVMVTPYWNPATQVRVCVHDAQTRGAFNGRSCSAHEGVGRKECGCGPNLRWCQSRPDETLDAIRNALADQLLQFMHRVVAAGRPYTDVLTARDIVVNGPLSHFLRFQSGTLIGIYGRTDQAYPVPVVPFNEKDKWIEATREANHAGILTMPGYLLRFATNRARANRFYNAFLCTEFQGPKDGLPLGGDPCNSEPNLQERCGCKVCHQVVEPAAAHWGRWAESGYAPLRPSAFPETNPDCAAPDAANNGMCRQFYLYKPGHAKEDAYKGKLLSYVFATEEMKANIAKGPIAIARKAIDSGAFARCTTRKLWGWLLGRAPLAQQDTKIEEIADVLRENKYRVQRVVRAIVKSKEYRQASLLGQ